MDQKKEFEYRKKAREVEEFRQSQSQRRQLINQALRDRKHLESEKVRRTKKVTVILFRCKKSSLVVSSRAMKWSCERSMRQP